MTVCGPSRAAGGALPNVLGMYMDRVGFGYSEVLTSRTLRTSGQRDEAKLILD